MRYWLLCRVNKLPAQFPADFFVLSPKTSNYQQFLICIFSMKPLIRVRELFWLVWSPKGSSFKEQDLVHIALINMNFCHILSLSLMNSLEKKNRESLYYNWQDEDKAYLFIFLVKHQYINYVCVKISVVNCYIICLKILFKILTCSLTYIFI